jgi:hypothetical protein
MYRASSVVYGTNFDLNLKQTCSNLIYNSAIPWYYPLGLGLLPLLYLGFLLWLAGEITTNKLHEKEQSGA